MARQVVRGILGIVLAAAATWLADRIVDQVFGPDPELEDELAESGT
jgi:thiol:disulfide interchange protein